MKNMEKKIRLRCSVCGNDHFAFDKNIDDMLNAPDETEIECSDCGKVTTKFQLIEDNRGIINTNIMNFKNDIMKQVHKKLKKMFE